jgi:hypothetical protein
MPARLRARPDPIISRRRLRRRLFFPSPAAVPGNCAGDSESLEKQIAMIAQKIVYAKHAQ